MAAHAASPDAQTTHEAEIRSYFAMRGAEAATFVAARCAGAVAGFIEIGTRSFAEGCETHPVACSEASHVDANVRQRGIGRALFEAGERQARKAGLKEMGSNAMIGNEVSIAVHIALGSRRQRVSFASASRSKKRVPDPVRWLRPPWNWQ